MMWKVCPSMPNLPKCSDSFLVVGKIHPAQDNQKCNSVCTGFGMYLLKNFQKLSLLNCVMYAQKAVCTACQAKLFKIV